MNLECINCGSVYVDRWEVDKCPQCPTCGVSHYVDTDEGLRPSNRKFRTASWVAPSDIGSWLPFYVLQKLTDGIVEIDQAIAYTVGLNLCKRPADKILWSLVIRNLIVSSVRKQRREVHILDAGYDTESLENLELDVLMRDYIKMLSDKWDADASKRKYNPSLADAANMSWPGNDSSDEERQMYKAVKEQLRRFRNSIENV
jgi:predicted  nucleic acid-binding Zn-ribbon protein